ncbi:MAG: serine/threonine-protein kinase, partial [Pseudonocardia sediminis]
DDRVVADRYRVHERVGSGGMGVVYRATDTRLKREVALKQVLLRGFDDAEAGQARRRTLREAEIAARVHHPRIVSIFDVIDDADGPLLVLEYLPSRSLGAVVAELGVLTPGVAARIGAQVAEALAAAHAAAIVHRDVKPGNVLVSPGDPVGSAKLADFGISHIPGSQTLTSAGIGTPAYFAPEVARGGDPTPAADVYALGATLAAVTQGAPPFGWSGENPLELIRRISAEPVPEPTIGGPLGELVSRMTDADPARRPSAADAVEQLWALADRPEPVHPAVTAAGTAGGGAAAPDAPRPDGTDPRGDGSGPTPPHSEPTHLPAGRSRAWYRRPAVVTGAALLLVLAVAAGTALTRGEPETPAAAGPPTLPASVGTVLIGDERTADPCLIDPAALSSFGKPTLIPDYGNLAACSVDLTQRGSDSYDVPVRWRPSASDPPEGEQQRIGDLLVVRRPPSDDVSCERYVLLTDGTQADINVAFTGDQAPIAAPCTVADAAVASAVTTLAQRGVPRRPAPQEPLGSADACTLIRPEDLSFLPPDRRTDTYRGFAGWSCDWSDGRDPELGITLTFDRYAPPSETGDPVPGTPAFVRVQDDDSCNGEIPRRQFLGVDGKPRAEELRVKVEGTGTPEQKCAIAGRLVTAANGRL